MLCSDPVMTFSSPHNWCDRRCERCPLADACAVAARSKQREWEHLSRGEDPFDVKVVIADVTATFSECIARLVGAAVEEGVPLDELDEPLPPLPPVAVELVDRALALFDALVRAFRDRKGDPVVDELLACASLLYAKAGRIGDSLREPRDDVDEAVFREDTVPNLLLLEHQEAAVTHLVGVVTARLDRSSGDVLAAVAALRQALRPLLIRVSSQAREDLELLQLARRAPSPFCTIPSIEPPEPS